MKVLIDYTNWRGERRWREIVPKRIVFERTQWHPDPQWILQAWDMEKNEERGFAMKDIHAWKPSKDTIVPMAAALNALTGRL